MDEQFMTERLLMLLGNNKRDNNTFLDMQELAISSNASRQSFIFPNHTGIRDIARSLYGNYAWKPLEGISDGEMKKGYEPS